MALPTLQRKLFKNDGYGPEIKDERLSTDITVKDWDASHDYPAGVLAKAGGDVYRSAAASGPGTTAGAVNPAQDAGAVYWEVLGNVVHKTGDESIDGTKTFKDEIVLENSDGISSNLYTETRIAPLDGSTFAALDTDASQLRVSANRQATSTSIVLCMDTNNTDVVDYNQYHILSVNSLDNIETGRLIFSRNADNISVGGAFSIRPRQNGADLQQIISGFLGTPDTDTNKWVLIGSAFKVFRPNNNGSTKLGNASFRWSQLYASTSTISTSDEREKTEIISVPDEVLDAWGEVEFCQYKMKDSVSEKGSENARIHNGAIAQRIDTIFKERNIDISKYGLFCYDSWESVEPTFDDKGNVITDGQKAGDEYSLRYEEVLCMEAAYQRRRADRAEARISALEARLAALEAKLNG